MARRRALAGLAGSLFLSVMGFVPSQSAEPVSPPDQLASAVGFLEKNPGDRAGVERVTALGKTLETPVAPDPQAVRRLVRQAKKRVENREADRRRALEDMSAATQEGWSTTVASLQRACRGADLELEVAVETPPDALRQYLRGYCETLGQKSGPPAEVDVHRVAGFLAYARANVETALKEWDLALPLAPKDTELKSFTQTLREQKIKDRQRSAIYQMLSQADRARADGDSFRAMSLYRKILTVDPSHPVAQEEVRRWNSQQNREKHQAALGAALRNARAEEAAGHREKARVHWLAVLELEPLHIEARDRLRVSQPSVPQAAVAAGPAPSPREAEQFYALGLVRYAAGDLAGARSAFSQCLKLNTQHPRAAKALARVREEERAHP